MKHFIIFVLFFFSLCTTDISATVIVKYITLKVGESTKEKGDIGFYGGRLCNITDPTVIEFLDWSGSINTYNTSKGVFYRAWGYVKGVKAGRTVLTCWSADKKKLSGNYSPEEIIPDEIYVITVLDVTSISIPSNISLTTGESFTYSPIITDIEVNATLTWTSSNTSIATVNSNGSVSALESGITTITCTAQNGVKAQSVVTVSSLKVSSVTLNKKNYEMSVGGTYTLTATVAPTNATQKTVNWLSSNENVAQVSDAGKVTAIAPGYCSIYAKADDGSGKFAKCLIHVTGTAGSRSDVNGDGEVTVTDAEVVIEEILSQP